MASGDTDRIEVMDISVAKKAENANAATGTEDDGSTFFKSNNKTTHSIVYNPFNCIEPST